MVVAWLSKKFRNIQTYHHMKILIGWDTNIKMFQLSVEEVTDLRNSVPIWKEMQKRQQKHCKFYPLLNSGHSILKLLKVNLENHHRCEP